MATPGYSVSENSLFDHLCQTSRTYHAWHICILVPQVSVKTADLSDPESAYWILALHAKREDRTLHSEYGA